MSAGDLLPDPEEVLYGFRCEGRVGDDGTHPPGTRWPTRPHEHQTKHARTPAPTPAHLPTRPHLPAGTNFHPARVVLDPRARALAPPLFPPSAPSGFPPPPALASLAEVVRPPFDWQGVRRPVRAPR